MYEGRKMKDHRYRFEKFFDKHNVLNYFNGSNYGDGFDSLAFACMYSYYYSLIHCNKENNLESFLKLARLEDGSFARHPGLPRANEMHRFSRDQSEQVLAAATFFDIDWVVEHITSAPWFQNGHLTNVFHNDPTMSWAKPPDFVLPTTRLLYGRKHKRPWFKDSLLLLWVIGKRFELLATDSFDPTAITTHLLHSKINSTPFAWLARKFMKYCLPMGRMWYTYCVRTRLDGSLSMSPPPFHRWWLALKELL